MLKPSRNVERLLSRLSAGRIVLAVALGLLATAARPAVSPAPTTPSLADRILVEKADHRLSLLRHGQVLKVYRVALGSGGLAPKRRQGDNLVPEGVYALDSRNAGSAYHRALHVSYPNAADRARARAQGVDPGGDIMVHGLPNGYGWLGAAHRLHDWTRGCIAVTDAEIEEIWRLVPNGVMIEIRP
ncbi:MAG TPA: L,D-transpeptidase family protein [Thermoanaerobaculia bacterium]